MRVFLILIILGVVILLQVTVLDLFQVAGVKPDLVLLLVIFNAFLRGSKEGAFLGFLGGLWQDILTGNYIGFNALAKMGAGYFVGLAESKLFKDSIVIVIGITLVATLASQLLYYLLLLILGIVVPPFWAFVRIIIPVALYNALLVPLFYKPFYRANIRGLLYEREI
ncbi:rod shape-determining protein MreD [Desulfolucanica intricata]|uniref:rod shape-determining protein MreD n=1 Tax=Desulfolucanica intricata TaxID=1285191 RepID=UPI00082AF387|nr:rod shape-determining protein MreD [Desulfolucanica intricata]